MDRRTRKGEISSIILRMDPVRSRGCIFNDIMNMLQGRNIFYSLLCQTREPRLASNGMDPVRSRGCIFNDMETDAMNSYSMNVGESSGRLRSCGINNNVSYF